MKLKEEFIKAIDQCSWSLLDKNIDRGAVFILDESLDIAEVAYQVSRDNKELVQNWLTQELIVKILSKENDELSELEFNYLIVQPFVFIQRINL